MSANERRPAGAASETGSRSDSESTFDLVNCTPSELIAWLSGYRSGIWQGTAEQIRQRETEDRAVYQMAVRTVHAMAGTPTRDLEADEAAHARREAWWAGRRGAREVVIDPETVSGLGWTWTE